MPYQCHQRCTSRPLPPAPHQLWWMWTKSNQQQLHVTWYHQGLTTPGRWTLSMLPRASMVSIDTFLYIPINTVDSAAIYVQFIKMSCASKHWNLWHYSGPFSDPRLNVPTEPSPFSACALWRQGYRESGQICCGETDVTVGSQLQILLHRNRIVRSVQPSTHSPPSMHFGRKTINDTSTDQQDHLCWSQWHPTCWLNANATFTSHHSCALLRLWQTLSS